MKNKLKKLLAGVALSLTAILGLSTLAAAQSGFGTNAVAQLFKRLGNAIVPINSSWTIGDSSNRVAGVYATVLDGTSVVVSGAVSGPMTVGTATVTSTLNLSYIGDSRVLFSDRGTATGTSDFSYASATKVLTVPNIVIPTSTLSPGSIMAYSTSDQTTNYERANMSWNGTTFEIKNEKAGAGADRRIRIGESGGGNMLLGPAASPSILFSRSNGTNSTAAPIYVFNAANLTGSSASQTLMSLNATFSQSSTAGYDLLQLNSTESSVGSGLRNLINARVGGTQVFTLDSTGKATSTALNARTLKIQDETAFQTLVQVNNTSTNASALSDISIRNGALGGTEAMDLYVLGTGYSGITGWTDAGVIIANSGLSGGLRFSSQSAPINMEVGGTGNSNVKLAVATTGITVTGNVSSTGVIYAPSLSALGATGDFVCQNNTTNYLEVQLANCTVSSIRFKEHVESMSAKEMMEKTRKLRAVAYDYKNGDTGLLGTPHDQGFIAEEVAMIDPYLVAWEEATPEGLAEVEKLYPGAVMDHNGKKLVPRTVDYMKVSVILSGAIQDLDTRLLAVEGKMGLFDRLVAWLKSVASL